MATSSSSTRRRPNFLWIGLDVLNLLIFRGFVMSPAHQWAIDHIWWVIWLLPILHSVATGNLFGIMLREEPETTTWSKKWKLWGIERFLLGYAGVGFVLFGCFPGFMWPAMMTVDPAGHGGFIYLVLGLVCPGFIAMIFTNANKRVQVPGRRRTFSEWYYDTFTGRRGDLWMGLVVMAYIILMESALFVGPRVNPEMGLGMSVGIAFVSFIPVRLMVFFLHSRNPLELITIGLSSADLIRQLVTAPGVLNTGMGFDSISW